MKTIDINAQKEKIEFVEKAKKKFEKKLKQLQNQK